MENRKMKIIWAVDPYSLDTSAQEITGSVIKAWAKQLSADIQPVHVHTNSYDDIPNELKSQFISGLETEVEEMIAEWRKRLELTDLLPAKVIECVNARSIRERVDSLLKYAHDSNADLIVTSTRAKTGVSRWLMGSFAETLALKSNIPMLFVNPSLDPIKQPISLDQILYPTDFSDESIQAFRTLLPIVKALGSKIEIFHQFRYAPSPGLDFAALAGAYIPHDDAKLEIETLRARVELWVDEARKHGVTAHFKISSNPLESVTHALLEESRKLHGAIAMAAMSNPIEVQLLGSITRQIIRTSTLPVWVYRAPAALE